MDSSDGAAMKLRAEKPKPIDVCDDGETHAQSIMLNLEGESERVLLSAGTSLLGLVNKAELLHMCLLQQG